MASFEEGSRLENQPSLSMTDDSAESVSEDVINILVELVGACNLKLEDNHHNDQKLDLAELRPFCRVQFGEETIHTTSKAEMKGPNPIWTIDTQSLFLLPATPAQLAKNTLRINIWSRRQELMQSETLFLGLVEMDPDFILEHCEEDRFEVNLKDEFRDDDDEDVGLCGRLALRMRMATPRDVRFIEAQKNNLSRDRIAAHLLEDEGAERQLPKPIIASGTDDSAAMQDTFLNAFSLIFSSKSFTEKDTGQEKIRVKPYPDPKRMKATSYMAPYDIKVETRRPSLNWVQAGSGTLGTVHLEILSCCDLPNVDVGEAVGNLTDSFVCAVYEDAVVETPVIDDELSPHWLPWTQRAFRFGMMHPASVLYLGVFDFDIGIGGHEPIGRVAVNVSNLQKDTVYLLNYNLYPSSDVTDRTSKGSIMIRLRIEMNDEKAALMEAFKPRKRIHVNTDKDKSFSVIRYTCFGEYGSEEKFDLTVLRSYINEIFEYKSDVIESISDTFTSLMFWRGQVKLFGIYLPIHSVVFFFAASTLVERPYMFPSFLFLGISWVMLANMTIRRHHPSPWHQCPFFLHYLEILRTGQSTPCRTKINANEGYKELIAQETARKKQLEEAQKIVDKKAEMQREIAEVGDDTIMTKESPASILPMELLERLGRYQGIVGGICKKFRLVKVVLVWEDSVASFWITAVFLALGLVSLLVPWAFVLTWTSRIAVWGLFGPHMLFVDLILRAHSKDEGGMEKIVAQFQKVFQAARIRREDALKLKAIKCLRFGQYITRVPAYNLARHFDRPLPSSTARLLTSPTELAKPALWLPGQQLFGVMIPRPEEAAIQNQLVSARERDAGLAKLQARITVLKAVATFGGELRLRRKKEHEEPAQAGYELVEDSDTLELVVQPSFCGALSSDAMPSFLVSPDDSEAGTIDEIRHTLADHTSELEAAKSYQDEEGVELVAGGRLCTVGAGEDDDEDPVFEDSYDDEDPVFEEDDGDDNDDDHSPAVPNSVLNNIQDDDDRTTSSQSSLAPEENSGSSTLVAVAACRGE